MFLGMVSQCWRTRNGYVTDDPARVCGMLKKRQDTPVSGRRLRTAACVGCNGDHALNSRRNNQSHVSREITYAHVV